MTTNNVAPQPWPIVHDDSEVLDALESFADKVDEAEKPIPYVPVDPAKQSAAELAILEKLLLRLTVGQRRELIDLVREIVAANEECIGGAP